MGPEHLTVQWSSVSASIVNCLFIKKRKEIDNARSCQREKYSYEWWVPQDGHVQKFCQRPVVTPGNLGVTSRSYSSKKWYLGLLIKKLVCLKEKFANIALQKKRKQIFCVHRRLDSMVRIRFPKVKKVLEAFKHVDFLYIRKLKNL